MLPIALISLALLTALAVLAMHYHNRSESRWFIERQQLQSKIDVLTEKLLQRDGVPVDLTRPARQQFSEQVRKVAFAHGWRSDKPATPNRHEEGDK